jgi:D-glycero-alpha-D-manno-heptose-7-phosphate kinase
VIICKTPFRISFFGGGTDFPEFFKDHGGAVLGTAIDKSIYHTVSQFPSQLFDYSIRLAYRQVECIKSVSEISHVPFREILRSFHIEKDVEINLAADLPSFGGLGSSSSFTVGLINALSAFQDRFMAKENLAKAAIHMERDVLKETIGCQDQVFAAYGGLNLIEFSGLDKIVVTPIHLPQHRAEELNGSLLLFFTKMSRRAQDLEKEKFKNRDEVRSTLLRIYKLVERSHNVLVGNKPLSEFGQLLDLTWREKQSLSPGVTNLLINQMYKRALGAGALGGKVLGAGGGGFMLFFVPPENQKKVREALSEYPEISFTINAPGSSIIHS